MRLTECIECELGHDAFSQSGCLACRPKFAIESPSQRNGGRTDTEPGNKGGQHL